MNAIAAKIEKLAFGGNGVCRIDGKVCFVPYSCPGDEAELSMKSEKRSYLTADIVRLISPSPDRVQPPCALFGRCGGCSWQHVGYEKQLEAKRQVLAETLWRGARVPEELVASTVPSASEFNYRRRVQFKLYLAAGRLQIGFYRQGSHFVEDAGDCCPIVSPVINDSIAALRSVFAGFSEPEKIPQINIDCTDYECVATVNYIGSDAERAATYFSARQNDLHSLTGLYLQTGRKNTMRHLFGDAVLTYELPGMGTGAPACRLSYHPGGFAQINTGQNAAMLEIVRRMGAFQSDDHVLDLYCGNGNFALPVSALVSCVTGIEDSGLSIDAAWLNCSTNGINNAEFIRDDAAAGVRRLAADGRRFDVVILDPPRTGAAEAVPDLCRLNADRIIYVSCDPSTLARDCGLMAAGGYAVTGSVPVDMFPQTYHIESVTLLKKR